MKTKFEVDMFNYLMPPDMLTVIKQNYPKDQHQKLINQILDYRLKILDAFLNFKKVAEENHHKVKTNLDFTFDVEFIE